jgi:cyclopropane fatty-acyl-phospholipid synthase-like methyltransferase
VAEIDDYESTTERLDIDDCSGSATSYLNYLFHLASYDFAAKRLDAGARVLDFGCGTGYGARHLADAGLHVIGVDVSSSAVDRATARYATSRLEFRAIQPVEKGPLPFLDESFDAVVSFQVVEHVPSVDAYVFFGPAAHSCVLRPTGRADCCRVSVHGTGGTSMSSPRSAWQRRWRRT